MYYLNSDLSLESRAPEAPGSLLLISPTAGLLHEHPDIKEVEKHDPDGELEICPKDCGCLGRRLGQNRSTTFTCKGRG